MSTTIPGYTYGTDQVARSPLNLEDLELLKATVLFTDEDVTALRRSREVLIDQIPAVLGVWYGFVGANPHLLRYFSTATDAVPDQDYLSRVRARFGQWILDTAAADYDQAWLDYQHEIGVRHTRAKKNTTDNADSVDHIALRYVLALVYPVTATLRPFLAAAGHSDEDVDAMHQTWLKTVLLQVILWSHPYVKDGDF